MKKIACLSLCVLFLAASLSSATLVEFSTSGSVAYSDDPFVAVGDTVNVKLFADNGGAGLLSQSWEAADLLTGSLWIDEYQLDIPGSWFDIEGPEFSTDSFGNLTSQLYGTFDFFSTDTYGSNTFHISGGWGFWNSTSQYIETNLSARSGWSVSELGAPVPEPSTWILLISGIVGLAVYGKK